ncbi:MAG TPA: response regulator [Pyrinomonadaceae bacterium]|nr:response regulator [Pyrinomonadaceae bacterium]
MKRRVLVAVDDLFFAAKIRTAAEHLGVEIVFPRSLDALGAAARESAPALVIVDLHLQRFDPFAVAHQLKTDEALRLTPLVGFFSHVQVELQRRAKQSGFDEVLPRSAFTKRLPEILQGQI